VNIIKTKKKEKEMIRTVVTWRGIVTFFWSD